MSLLTIIESIDVMSGNQKLEGLKKNPILKPILKMTYDPFKRFYITAPDLEGTTGGSNINRESKTILDSLSSRELSGNAAFREVCDHITTLNPDSAEVFKMILNKDLRCGISVKTVNKVWPGLIPMNWDGSIKPDFALCKTFDPKKAVFPLLVAIKKDGVRSQYTDCMVGRSGKKIIGQSHIEDQLECNLDGELTIPNAETFDDGSGLIRNSNENPDSVFWVFDAPSVPGTKLERYQWLEKNLKRSENVRLLEHFLVKDMDELKHIYDCAVSNGEEGIVIYDPNGEYEDGRIWWRLVPIKSEDLPVVGFFPGKGKHAGSLGGIIVDYNGHKVKVGTGFKEKVVKRDFMKKHPDLVFEEHLNFPSHDIPLEGVSHLLTNLRSFIWKHRDHFKGVTAKVSYKEKTKAGSLRQPRFKGWRFDK